VGMFLIMSISGSGSGMRERLAWGTFSHGLRSDDTETVLAVSVAGTVMH
jgi:hypothetical protein